MDKTTAASAVSVATFLGVTLAEVEQVIRIGVGALTLISLVLLCAVHIKKLREK